MLETGASSVHARSMTQRTEIVNFSVTGPRHQYRGLALDREADEIAGIEARRAGASSWTRTPAGSMHTGGPDEEIEHRFQLHLTFAE